MKTLQDAFKKLGSRAVDTFPAKVMSVDKTNGTCVVNDGEIDYTGVQLSATIEDSGKRFFLYPKVGSYVLVSPINEDIHRLYVEFWSEIEELNFETQKSQMKINDQGFLLKKEEETLANLMKDLLQEIQRMKFTTNVGSTVNLINSAKFKQLENRFKSFLQ